MKRIQYSSIDLMRIITAFCVVIGHFVFPGDVGQGVWLVAHYAVPFFFIVSGFFVWTGDKLENAKRMRKSMKHIGELFLLTGIVYLLFNLAYAVILKQQPITEYLSNTITKEAIVNFFAFNLWPFEFGGAIWYLHALLYGYVILYVMNRFDLFKFSAVIVVVFLIINAAVGEFSTVLNIQSLIHVDFIGGCFFTRAIPYMLIGTMIRRNKEQLIKIKSSLLIAMLVISAILTLVEYYLLITHNLLHYPGHYQGNTIFAVAIFIYLIQRPDLGKNGVLAMLGHKYSLPVYLIHQPLGWAIERVIAHLGLDILYNILPVIVFCASLVTAYIYYKMKHIFMTKRLIPEKTVS